jgi:hypothetical protein
VKLISTFELVSFTLPPLSPWEADADTITDFDVTTDKLNLIDVILYPSGGITDSASLANYIHAEADASVAINKRTLSGSIGYSEINKHI